MLEGVDPESLDDDVVDEPVLLGGLRGEPPVAVGGGRLLLGLEVLEAADGRGG